MNRPNVLLLTIDTLRADMLGRTPSITPNLDRLAADGINFTQAITGGSWTQAAFPVILTSTYASMYGGCLGPLASERPSPVEALASHGYTTAAFSTSPLLSRNYKYDRGFQHFIDLETGEKEPILRSVKGGQHLLRYSVTHYVGELLGQDLRPPRLYASAEALNEKVIRWLDDMETPFFGWVHYMDIHWPYHLYDSFEHPKDIARIWRDLAHLHEVNFQGGTITPDQRNYYVRLYEEAVRYTDAQVGRLLGYIEESGLADNTVVIVVSDHGEEFLERRHWGHVEINLYDEIVKVPFILYIPDGPGGRVVKRQTRLLDLMPTVLDLCECPALKEMEGSSLLPIFREDDREYDGSIAITERWRDTSHIIAVRTESFKGIWDTQCLDRPKLFDLRADPGEREDVSHQYPEVVGQLRANVGAHLDRTASTMPGKRPAEPDLDREVIDRLRGLGYVE